MEKLLLYKIWCTTDQKFEYIWLPESSAEPTLCPSNTLHEVDLESVAVDQIRKSDEVSIKSLPAFADKTLANGQKIYRRVHGVKIDLVVGINEFVWVNPYPWAKFMSTEVINCTNGDTVSMYVLDDVNGTITTIPNYELNQFAFDVNVSKDFYQHKCEFDADIYLGLQLKFVINSVSIKSIGVNFVLNEVKET